MMNELLNVLTRKENNWSLEYDKNIDLLDAINDRDVNPCGLTTISSLKQSIKTRIEDYLKGEDCHLIEYKKATDHIALSFYCDGKYLEQLRFLTALKYYVNPSQICSTQESNWIEVHRLLQVYLNLSQCESIPDVMNGLQRPISDAVIRLRNKGYKVTIENGFPYIDEENLKRILDGIEYRKNAVGSWLLTEVLKHVKMTYNIKHDRYYLRKELKIRDNDLQIPFGYLYNLAISSLSRKKKTTKTKYQIMEIFELSKDLMCIFKIQRTDYFESVMHGHYDIVNYIRKNILHDQIFTIQQYSSINARIIINGLFNTKENKELTIDFGILLDIYDLVCILGKDGRKRFHVDDDIISRLMIKYPSSKIKEAVNSLSISINDVNLGYINPFEIDNINMYTRPFIKDGEFIYYIIPNFHRNGFIFSLYQKLLEELKGLGFSSKKIGKIIGDISEEFTSSLLKKSKIVFKRGLEYKIPKNYLSEIDSTSIDGECDFIIETNDKIVFIEQKSKTLTANARKGDIASGLLDISQSLLNSIEQAGRHEYLLRKDGSLKFNDGSIINLGGRDIEKVSLTLFDFHSLADVDTIRSLLSVLLNNDLEYTGDDLDVQRKIDEINNVSNKLKKQYSSKLFKSVYLSEPGQLITHNVRFFSANQLISMLEYSNGNEDLLDVMSSTRQIVNNTQDWFFIFGNFSVNLKRLTKKTFFG